LTGGERFPIVPPAMKTVFRLILCAVASVPAWSALRAAEAPSSLAKGQVLLLRSDRMFEGEVEQVGDQYRVKRPGGGETWIRADMVQRVCSSREDAYDYLRSQANLDDPDERLRLAKWCQVNNLREQAIAEIRAAVAMRPEHEASRRLLNSWLQAVMSTPSKPSRPESSKGSTPPVRPHDAGIRGQTAIAYPPDIDLNAELVGQFIRKVQPILMNTCVRCHAAGRGNPFELLRVTGDGLASRKSTQQNLAAVLAQIKPEQPLASPLLVMAVSVHGGAVQAPLRNRETPAYRCLEDWVKKAAAEHVPTSPRVATPPEPPSQPKAPPAKSMDDPAPPPPLEEKAPVQPVDEFDPLIFNRQMHPERNLQPSGER
jgi:hypothetical protein